MWESSLRGVASHDETRRNPWHNEDESPRVEVEETPRDSSPALDSGESVERNMSGTWGEHDAGEVHQNVAMEDFEALRRTLTSISRTRSHAHSDRDEGFLQRTVSRRSTRRESIPRRPTIATTTSTDSELEDFDASAVEKEDDFELSEFMKEGHFEKRKDGQSTKKVGVIWKNLTVKGTGSTATFVRTLPDAVLGTFGPDLYHIISRFIPALRFSRHTQTRTLLHGFSGVVKDGEMMLVLGRPGSGCSTFLKAIANNREGYAAVDGDISYGGIPAEEQKKRFRGEVNYNPEDDTHFANLNVWQTLYFALINKTKKKEQGDIPVILEALLKIFGISHTKYTPVGDEFVRGVSGGERKRVCYPEALLL
jgi:ABC-type uncharacterized transport system YnjBCD ATPase subunit